MFGRRTAEAEALRPTPAAPPPAPISGPAVATRPQPKPPAPAPALSEDGFDGDDEFIVVAPRRETAAALREKAKSTSAAPTLPQNSGSRNADPGPGPKNTAGFEQLRAAQNAVQVV